MGKFGKPWPEEDLKKIKVIKKKENTIIIDLTHKTGSPLRKYKGNKRVRNATKCEVDGIVFASKLEAMMYIVLKNYKIPHERQHKIILQPKFKTEGKAIRAITWTVDFFFPWCDILLDTKGYATEIAKIKMKMFYYMNRTFSLQRKMYNKLIIAKTQKEVESEALKLLELWQAYQKT